MEVSKLTKGFFVRVHVNVITDERLSIYEKMAYVALCRFADREGRCFPGLDTLAHLAGCSRSRLHEALKKLQALSYVQITKRCTRGKRHSNLYTLPLLKSPSFAQEAICVSGECDTGAPERHITISNIIKEQDPGELLECTARTPHDGHETFTYVPNLLPEPKEEAPLPVYFNNFKKPKDEQAPSAVNAETSTPKEPEPYVIKHPPYEEIVKSYVRHFPDRKAPVLNNITRFRMRIASMIHHELYEVEGWDRYFDTVANTPFLMGENPGGAVPPFTWLINSDAIKRVKQGYYARGGQAKAEWREWR